jgi:hypothetical protein
MSSVVFALACRSRIWTVLTSSQSAISWLAK